MLKNLENLPIKELRERWEERWGIKPHLRLGRRMLERSLHFKVCEQRTGGLTADHQEKLIYFLQQYKRNPSCFDGVDQLLKPGTRLVRVHRGKKHSVIVKAKGFEYQGQLYNSLSKIAREITGKNWNGWVFFGLKKAQ